MSEQNFDYGMTGKESREAKEWVEKKGMSRREFIGKTAKSGAKIAVGLGSIPIICGLCNLLTKVGSIGPVDNPLAGNMVEQERESRVSWLTMLKAKNAEILWKSIDFYRRNLNQQTQQLSNFTSIEQTQLGIALFGYRDFINNLRTPSGRNSLRDDIKALQGQMDTGGYPELLTSFEKYANTVGSNLSNDQLGQYFTKSDNGPNYPQRDWEFMEGVYKAVNGKNGEYLFRLMDIFKDTEAIPQK